MNSDVKKVVDALRFSDCIGTQCKECVCNEWCDGDTRSLEEEAADLIERMAAKIEDQKIAISKLHRKNKKLVAKNVKLQENVARLAVDCTSKAIDIQLLNGRIADMYKAMQYNERASPEAAERTESLEKRRKRHE